MTAASPGVVAIFLANEYYPSARGLPRGDRQRHEGRVRGDRQRRLRAAARLPGPGDEPPQPLRRPEHWPSSARSSRATSRCSTRRRRTSRPERMRLHLCWGNYEGPHHLDVPLQGHHRHRAQGQRRTPSPSRAPTRVTSTSGTSGRTIKLPDDKVLIPGVIDSTTNFIEHPELVAQRIVRYAERRRPRERHRRHGLRLRHLRRVDTVDPRIAWAKLKALAEGAALASKELW